MGARGSITKFLVTGSLALLAGLACSFGLEAAAPCLHDDNCASGSCQWGICVTGTCVGTSGCKQGWTCVDPPPSDDILDKLLLGHNDPIGHCALECEGCPDEPRYSCTTICSFDHDPHLEIVAPTTAEVGASVPLTGIIDLVEGRALASAVWTVTDRSRGGTVDIDGPEVLHTFTEYGDYALLLVVTDSGERSAMATADISVCALADGACEYDAHCCDAGYCQDGACHPAAVCGNGVLERGELCDGAITDGASCSDFEGHLGGPLRCRGDCLDYDLGSCDTCGPTFADCTSDDQCCPGLTCSPGVQFCS